MASSSVPASPGDPANAAPQTANDHFAAVFGQSDPEAIRRAYLREEAYVKAVGIMNYLYFIFFGAFSAYYVGIALLHRSGKVSAAWSVQPGWIALESNGCVMAILALAAGYGFRRLKHWALRVEAFFVLCCLFYMPLSIFAYSQPMGIGYLAAGISLMSALLVPLLNLWDVRKSRLFTPEYRRVVAMTTGVRVRARLPWELKIPAILLMVLYLIICSYMAAR